MTRRERIIELEVQMWPKPLQMAYKGLVKAGQSAVMAHMLACQSAPTMGMTSDRQFNSSYRRKMNSMSQWQRDKIVAIARKAGIETNGKYYVGGLGKYDDPAAWCATADDVAASARRKGLTAQGPGVNHVAPEPPPKPKVDLAPDIVAEYKNRYKREDPALAEKCKKNRKAEAELTERVVSTHGKKKKG